MNFAGLALYLFMLVCELPGAVLRFLQVLLVGLVLGFALGGILHLSASSVTYWAFFLGIGWALFPLAWSLLMLVFPISPGTVGKYGAREAVPEELDSVRGALETFYSPVPLPSRWYVISDSTWFDGHVLGDKLFVTQATIQSRYLAPLLVHELGHLNMRDGRMVLAVQRLINWPHWAFFVGLGGFVTGRFWFKWAHDREFAVDDYAYRLGLQEETIAMIEEIILPFEQSRPADMVAWLPFKRVDTHPTAMQRISRLRAKPPLDRPVEEAGQEPQVSWLDRPAPGWFMRSRFGRWYAGEVVKQRELGAKEYVARGLREGMQEVREEGQKTSRAPGRVQTADRAQSWRERLHEAAEARRAELAARKAQQDTIGELVPDGEALVAVPVENSVLPAVIDLSDLRARYGWNDAVQAELERGIYAQIRELCERSEGQGFANGPTELEAGADVEREPGTATPTEHDPWRSVIDLTELRTRYRWDDATQARMEEGTRMVVVQQFEALQREDEIGGELSAEAGT